MTKNLPSPGPFSEPQSSVMNPSSVLFDCDERPPLSGNGDGLLCNRIRNLFHICKTERQFERLRMLIKRFTNTETTRPATSAAVGKAGESPKGLGWDGNKPLMRNRTAMSAIHEFEVDSLGGLPWFSCWRCSCLLPRP